MKKFLVAGLLAAAAALAGESSASAQAIPPGIGTSPSRIGRIRGYWLNPTRGHLYDYSAYFAARYPQLPNSQEYQWQPPGPHGAYGTSMAVLPAAPPPVAAGRAVPLQTVPPATAPAVPAPPK